ncbi:MAG: hypothetical protein A2017_06775 [Lentisphaerae bacterium GWF2_44_16]|nr:MAG: hypothetical protein A2017_06775 [Lentisphaerae bacterium GWF2_44_16]
MQISDYSVEMDSSHELLTYSKKEESLIQWIGDESARKKAYEDPVELNLSDKALERLQKAAASGAPENIEDAVKLSLSSQVMKVLSIDTATIQTSSPKETEPVDLDTLKIQLIESLMYAFTGKRIKIKLVNSKDIEGDGNSNRKNTESILKKLPGGEKSGAEAQKPAGWGLDYNYYELKAESETVSFNSKALVKTADGREINIDLALNMSRSFIQEKSLSIKAGDALIDPLVINLNGNITGLSDTKFEFDLDADGKKEQISELSQGSAFLALDKNNDGVINDGKELFGPSSGSGFGELSSYDEDKNGWIDESDSIYDSLRLWFRNSDGSNSLMAIGQAGIGAIYLGSANTQFSMNDAENNTKGKLAQTGFYLNENGTAGLVHELDLAV